ncbi:MAG: hypothetical protein QM767_11545 [Anaeromyxobacter sp.]
MRSPFPIDFSRPVELTPKELRLRLEDLLGRRISARTFAYWRKQGWVAEPFARRPRGYRGECCVWTTDQVPRMAASIAAHVRRSATKKEIDERVSNGRERHNERRREAADIAQIARACAENGLYAMARVSLMSLLRSHGVEVQS